MKTLSLFDEVKHFMLDNVVSFIPQQVSRIAVHALLTVGIFQGWKIFRKQIKKFK
ncbi:MAG: hypothetical protein ACP5NS_01095 [Candidatus Pacearchaeota archaeon]